MGRLSKKKLIEFADSASTMVDAGLPLSRALDVVATQRHGRLRAIAARAQQSVKHGATLAEALEESRAFPPLFVRLVEAGEVSGQLQKCLSEAARLYEFERQLALSFLSGIALPAIEYVLAIAVVSATLYVLKTFGLDLGAPLLALGMGYGLPAGIAALYFFVVKPLGGSRIAQEVSLRVPMLGKISQYVALSRFSLIMELMLEAGVPITEGARRALQGTNNAAFGARAEKVCDAIGGGSELAEALQLAGLFPWQYLEILQVAEESGTLTERFRWLADDYADRSRRALRALVAALGALVWVGVAIVIIIFIFRLFGAYAGGIESAMPG